MEMVSENSLLQSQNDESTNGEIDQQSLNSEQLTVAITTSQITNLLQQKELVDNFEPPLMKLHTFEDFPNDFNDDCIENIIKYLNIRDQLRCSKISTRFANVFQMFAKCKYRKLDSRLLAQETATFRKIFLETIGEYVTSLTYNGWEFLESILTTWNRNGILRTLHITAHRLKLLRTLAVTHTLDYSCLDLPFVSELVNSKFLNEVYTFCKNLEELHITYDDHISFDDISSLEKLNKIYILFQGTTCLLRIQRFLVSLAKYHYNNLIVLSIDFGSNWTKSLDLNIISSFKNLKEFYLIRYNTEMPEFQFGKSDNLTKIGIFNCMALKENQLMDIVNNCENLEKLDVQNCCRIKPEFADKLYEVQKTREHLCRFNIQK